jgi:S-formylglutathione hydrolase FrmB
LWLDVGQDDWFAAPTIELHQLLSERGIEHVWELNPGTHSNEYWAEHVPEYLRFFAGALAQDGPSTNSRPAQPPN